MSEIIEKHQTIQEYEKIIERAKQINPSVKDKLETINLNQSDITKEEIFNLELGKRFTTKQRSEMKMCKLDNYCLFITSRYFSSLDDHINLVKFSKKTKRKLRKVSL